MCGVGGLGAVDLFCFCIEVFSATDEGVFFDDGKIFKKVSILSCDFGIVAYSMSVARKEEAGRVLNQSKRSVR